MKNLNFVAEQLFNQIRGRFPNITIGDEQGNVTNEPQLARFFDFDYENNGKKLGKVSVSLDENDGVIVMYSKNFIENSFGEERSNWFSFLKDMRMFSKKRLLNFEVRDINRSNLTKRDYKFLAANRRGDGTMTESTLYGKNKVSYQKIDNARLVIRHNESVNPDIPGSRTRHIKSIYIESADGERFKYPYKHLSGARAMARHVSEGGNQYDDFGKHITGLSEELSKLRKFKTYMGRSSVMAESLSGYMDVVKERISEVKKTINNLQKPIAYKEAIESFEAAVYEDVPADVAENWIDQLTIKQFNEELKDVFPYIYRLVSEATRAKELGPEDLDEAGKMKGGADDPCWKGYKMVGHKKKGGREVPNCVPEEIELEAGFDRMMGQFSESDKETDEGNAYAHAVRQAKMNGKKKGDKITGPNGDEVTLEKEHKIPLGEFILSYFDRETGQFPKGETAVLTMIEKDYGDQFVMPAKAFIEQINNLVAERYGFKDTELEENPEQDLNNQVLSFARYLLKHNRQMGIRASDLLKRYPGEPKTALMSMLSDPVLKKMWQNFSNMQNFSQAPVAGKESLELDRISRLAGL